MNDSISRQMQNKYGKVGVLMGGWSAEREISLMSGEQVLNALISGGVDAHAIDVDRDVIDRIKNGQFDRVFNILHGRGGEDGEIQGALELNRIPYTGSGVLGSALAINKLKAKEVCHACDIRTPAWKRVDSYKDCLAVAAELNFPLVLKPIFEGSSIGVSIVRQESDLDAAFLEASRFGPVLAEQFIDGMELTVSVLGQEALPVISMSTDREFYDYHAKYFDDDTRYQCPSGLPPDKEKEIQSIALEAFEVLAASGWGRVDFMMDAGGLVYFIELNTLPGMTTHSLVPMAARQMGMDFQSLCLKILDSSLEDSK